MASNIDIPPLGNSTAEFQYRPLDSKNCIRLIEFEIAENANDPPRCKLIHASFGETPEYEALSYRWGDETFKTEILVDGKRLLVGQNLWDALHCLRKRANGRHYWADAICINQADIPERNQQAGTRNSTRAFGMISERMPRKLESSKERVNSLRTRADCTFSASELQANARKKLIQVEMAKIREIKLELLARELRCLCTDEYWGRVWIVQEIGKAEKLLVCFGEQEMAWDAFIEKIESYAPQNAKEGIMKLARQRRGKYHLGHTLRELLQNHQHAVCQDPRDKIYGFVGLEIDASKFPMDYQKSLFEVWKDTMLFANKPRMPPGSDIVPFGKMVKRLLGGSSVTPIDQVAREYASWTNSPRPIEDTRDPTIFNLSAYIAGMTRRTGPSPERMRSAPEVEVGNWKKRIFEHFQADLGNAHREDDLLMRVLLKSKTVDSGVLSFPHPRICWKPVATFKSMIDNHREKSNKYKQQRTREFSIAQQTKPSMSTPESCLYLIKRVTGHNSPWKIGIAAGAAQPGDLVCWVRAARKLVIERMDGDWLQIVGTAVDPKDLWEQRITEQDFKSHEEFELSVDVETAYTLIA